MGLLQNRKISDASLAKCNRHANASEAATNNNGRQWRDGILRCGVVHMGFPWAGCCQLGGVVVMDAEGVKF